MYWFAQYDRVDVPLRQGGKSEGQGDIQFLLFSVPLCKRGGTACGGRFCMVPIKTLSLRQLPLKVEHKTLYTHFRYKNKSPPSARGKVRRTGGYSIFVIFWEIFVMKIKSHQNKQNVVMGEVNYQNPSSERSEGS